MNTPNAREWLGYLWAVIYCASYRKLEPEEIEQLQILCEWLENYGVGRPSFDRRAENCCAMIRSSGLESGTGDPQKIEALLEEIDRLRELLGT